MESKSSYQQVSIINDKPRNAASRIASIIYCKGLILENEINANLSDSMVQTR